MSSESGEGEARGSERVIERASRFVSEAGAPPDQAFLDVLTRRRDFASWLSDLALEQGSDGSLGGGLRSTLRLLTRLDALGMFDHPVGEAAVAFVSAAQHGDGGWDDGASAGDEAARIALTGAAAGLLAKTPFARESALTAAERFLVERWSVERVQGPDYEPILAYTPLLVTFPSEASDEILQWCGRELERGFRMQAFDPLPVARVFLRSRARALPGCAVEPHEIATGLITAQEADGGWPTEGGATRVDAALEGIEAMLRLA